jgi:hypothetical protein
MGYRFHFKRRATPKQAYNILQKISDKTGLELHLENNAGANYVPGESLENYTNKFHGTFTNKYEYISIAFDLCECDRKKGEPRFSFIFLNELSIGPNIEFGGDPNNAMNAIKKAGEYYIQIYKELDKRLGIG